MNLSKKDAGELLAIGFFVACALISCLFAFGSKYINVVALVVFVLVVQYIFITPALVKYYYQVNGVKASWDRFIPIWNELSLFTPTMALLSIISWLVCIIAGVLTFLNPELFVKIIGERGVLNYGTFMLRTLIATLLINNIIRGIAIIKFNRVLNLLNKKFYKKRANTNKLFVILQSVTCFIPCIRIVCMLLNYNMLFRIAAINRYKSKQNNK